MGGLDALLKPRSIAVIGASTDPGRVGGMPLHFLERVGYPGAIHPVNQRHEEVQGRRAYRRVGDVPGPLDLAIVAVAADRVVDVVVECADAGVRGAIIFSAGFAETGAAGRARQEELAQIAARTGIRLCGPNCAGIMNVPARMTASFGSHLAADTRLIAGSIAIVSQSGAVGAYLFTLSRQRGVGLSYWVTTGNEVDTQAADYVRAIAADPATRVIALYLEEVRDAESLMEACDQARANEIALVGVLAGRSKRSERALRSHTAALAGDRDVAAAALDELGIARVDTIEDLLTAAIGAGGSRRPRSGGVGIVTISGAAGIMMVDRCDELRLNVPVLPAAVQDRIQALLPYLAADNPVDITGNISNTPEIFAPVLEELLASDAIQSVVCFLGHVPLSPHVGARLVGDICASASSAEKPIWLVGLVPGQAEMDALVDAEVPLVTDPVAAITGLDAATRAVIAATGVTRPGILSRRRSHETGAAGLSLEPSGSLSEKEAQHFLALLGVPFPAQETVRSGPDAAAAATRLGPAVAMKILSRDIFHKSDVGGVRVGVRPDGAAQAFDDIVASVRSNVPSARVDGVLVQKQLDGHPVIVGARDDQTFGPVVLVGSGGIYTELLADRAIALAPVDAAAAEALIDRTKLPTVLRGARGGPPLARERLVDIIVAVSRFAWSERDRLAGVELNPVLVGPTDAVAVDALIETKGNQDGA